MGEAAERKQRSHEVLERKGIPINPHLPMIEIQGETIRRTVDEVADRATGLCAVAVKAEAHGVAEPSVVKNHIAQLVDHLDCSQVFTPLEAAFIDTEAPSEQDQMRFMWNYEALWTLLWALGHVDELERPDHHCDVAKAVSVLREHKRQGLIASSTFRPQAEIFDEADLVYRYHWAATDAWLKGQQLDDLDPGVVMERHRALNWLIGYDNQPWDDVTTDT